MSEISDRFPKQVIENLAKRSANICSNPDCQAITSGPSADEGRSVNLGEAAHIYGANPGSARYDVQMISAERSAITNAIWLCRNCHKIVDADPNQYPAELLFEWRREHEVSISEKIGKTSDRLRRKIVDAQLEGFEHTTYLARQIVIDKPDGWEYRLTAELLRHFLEPISSRSRALGAGLYVKPHTRVASHEAIAWFQDRLAEVSKLGPALATIANEEFAKAWGAPGTPGSPDYILRTCKLFAEACQQLLHWEETVRFTSMPSEVEPLQSLLSGLSIRLINQVESLPSDIAKVFGSDNPTGTHHISFILDVPDGWPEKVDKELKKLELVLTDPDRFI